MKLKVLLPTKILVEEEVQKVVAEAGNGGIPRGSKCHFRFILCWAASCDQEKPTTLKIQHARCAAVLSHHCRSQHISIERSRRAMSLTTRIWVSSMALLGKSLFISHSFQLRTTEWRFNSCHL